MACGGSSPNLTASSIADIQDCYDNHVIDGATITVAAGSYTITSGNRLLFDDGKHFKLVPGGVVNITDNVCAGECGSGAGDSMIYVVASSVGACQIGAEGDPDAGAGFNFPLGTSRHTNPSALIYVLSSSKPVLILGNKFGGTGDDGWGGNVVHIQGYNGVIRGNWIESWVGGGTCLNNAALVRNNWDGTGWVQSPLYGSADTNQDYKIYVENNYAKNTLECLDLQDGGRFVVRNNEFINSAIIYHGADTQRYGGRYAEMYNNTWTRDSSAVANCSGNDVNGNGHIALRGGTGIIVNNSISTYPTNSWGAKTPIVFFLENIWRAGDPLSGAIWECWGTVNNDFGFAGYPNPYQVGWGYDESSSHTQAGNATWLGDDVMLDREPVYLAGNTGGGNYDNASVQNNADGNQCSSTEQASDYVVANREFYNQTGTVQTNNSTPFSGATGTGFGTRISPNYRPTNCTTGVAYWATDAGDPWNDGAVGGCLDLCDSTNHWTDCWYTPATYPSIWITGSPADEPAPSVIQTSRKLRLGWHKKGRY